MKKIVLIILPILIYILFQEIIFLLPIFIGLAINLNEFKYHKTFINVINIIFPYFAVIIGLLITYIFKNFNFSNRDLYAELLILTIPILLLQLYSDFILKKKIKKFEYFLSVIFGFLIYKSSLLLLPIFPNKNPFFLIDLESLTWYMITSTYFIVRKTEK